LWEEGGLNPQLRYVKRGKLRVVEMPHRLRLDPAAAIKTVVEKEKPEVVNITAMAWLGESDSPSSDGVDEGQPFAPKEKEVLVSITFDDSATKYGLGSDVKEADITIDADEPEKEILQGPTVHEVHRATAKTSVRL